MEEKNVVKEVSGFAAPHPRDEILLVDDDEVLRESLRVMLERMGFVTHCAATAKEALEHIEHIDLAVAVIDLVLDEGDGMEVFRRLKRVQPEAECVILTGHASTDSAIEAVNMGAFSYIEKPCGIENIVVAVRMAAERKRSRTLLREANRKLEQTIEQLRERQAEEIRRERLHALAQMAGGIVHDFNNMLQEIIGRTELMLSRGESFLGDGRAVAADIKAINAVAKKAAEVVSRLHRFYIGQQSNAKEEGTPGVDVAEAIRESVEATRHKWHTQALQRGVTIDLQTDVAEDLPPTRGTPAEVSEVITNLILNAADAMEEDGRITVRARKEGDFVRIEVEDTGKGMSEEVRRRCIEPFFTTKGQFGSGLGLAVVLGIVNEYGGTMEVQSAEGRGTLVTIKLPICNSAEVEKANARAPSAAKKENLTVLLVEDEEPVRNVIKLYLEHMGHDVVEAENGQEALKVLKDHRNVDLVMTDMAMPGMDGAQLALEAKRLSDVPVILITGFGTIMETVRMKPEGIDAVLTKPVTLHDVERTIGELMKQGGNEDAG